MQRLSVPDLDLSSPDTTMADHRSAGVSFVSVQNIGVLPPLELEANTKGQHTQVRLWEK